MGNLSLYNGTAFANVTPYLCEVAGSWANPTTVQIYDGTAWQTVWGAVSFTPVPGSYSKVGILNVSYNIVCTVTATWTYSIAGDTAYLTRTPASGGTGTTLTLTLAAGGASPGYLRTPTTATISNIYATINGIQYGPWNIQLDTDGEVSG